VGTGRTTAFSAPVLHSDASSPAAHSGNLRDVAVSLSRSARVKEVRHDRPVFHSKADLQHALAWGSAGPAPQFPVRFTERCDQSIECRPSTGAGRGGADPRTSQPEAVEGEAFHC
jgi:hypothetical protein